MVSQDKFLTKQSCQAKEPFIISVTVTPGNTKPTMYWLNVDILIDDFTRTQQTEDKALDQSSVGMRKTWETRELINSRTRTGLDERERPTWPWEQAQGHLINRWRWRRYPTFFLPLHYPNFHLHLTWRNERYAWLRDTLMLYLHDLIVIIDLRLSHNKNSLIWEKGLTSSISRLTYVSLYIL